MCQIYLFLNQLEKRENCVAKIFFDKVLCIRKVIEQYSERKESIFRKIII